MTERFTYFKEDNGYWIRDESNYKIIATGLKLGVAQNICSVLNEQNETIERYKRIIDKQEIALCNNDIIDEENSRLLKENKELEQALKKVIGKEYKKYLHRVIQYD